MNLAAHEHRATSWQPNQLVRLETQSPLGISEAILNCQLDVFFPLDSVERLKEEVSKVQFLKPGWLGVWIRLGEDEFEFVALS